MDSRGRNFCGTRRRPVPTPLTRAAGAILSCSLDRDRSAGNPQPAGLPEANDCRIRFQAFDLDRGSAAQPGQVGDRRIAACLLIRPLPREILSVLARRDHDGRWRLSTNTGCTQSFEQIGMGAGTCQDQFVLGLAPDEQPVWFDVTFTKRPPLTGERMRAMSRLQRFVLQQLLDHRPRLVELLAAFLGSFEVTLKALCGFLVGASATRTLEGFKVGPLCEVLALERLTHGLSSFKVWDFDCERQTTA